MPTRISEVLYFVCLERYLQIVETLHVTNDAKQLRVLALYCWNAGHSLGDQI